MYYNHIDYCKIKVRIAQFQGLRIHKYLQNTRSGIIVAEVCAILASGDSTQWKRQPTTRKQLNLTSSEEDHNRISGMTAKIIHTEFS